MTMASKKKAKNIRAIQLQQTIKLKMDFIEHQKQNIFDLVESFIEQLRAESQQMASKEDNTQYLSVIQQMDQASKILDCVANFVMENTVFDDSSQNDSPDVEIEEEDEGTNLNQNLTTEAASNKETEDFSIETPTELSQNKNKCETESSAENIKVEFEPLVKTASCLPEKSGEGDTGSSQQLQDVCGDFPLPSTTSNSENNLTVSFEFQNSAERAPVCTSSSNLNYSVSSQSVPLTSQFSTQTVCSLSTPDPSVSPFYTRGLPPAMVYMQGQYPSITQPLIFPSIESQHYSSSSSTPFPVETVHLRPPFFRSIRPNLPQFSSIPFPSQNIQSINRLPTTVSSNHTSFSLPMVPPALRHQGNISLFNRPNQCFNIHPRQLLLNIQQGRQHVSEQEMLNFASNNSFGPQTNVLYPSVPQIETFVADSLSKNAFPSIFQTQGNTMVSDEISTQSNVISTLPSKLNLNAPPFHPTLSSTISTKAPASTKTDKVKYENDNLDSHLSPPIKSSSDAENDNNIHSVSMPQIRECSFSAESEDIQPTSMEFDEDGTEERLQTLLRKLDIPTTFKSVGNEKRKSFGSLSSNTYHESSISKTDEFSTNIFVSVDTNSKKNQEDGSEKKSESSSQKSFEQRGNEIKRHSSNQLDKVDMPSSKKPDIYNEQSLEELPNSSSKHLFHRYDDLNVRSSLSLLNKNNDDGVDDAMSCVSFESDTKLIEQQSKISRTPIHQKGKVLTSPPQLSSQKDTVLAGKVVNAKHPWSFHVQISGKINLVQKYLEEIVEQGILLEVCKNPSPATFCLTIMEDDQQLHRARVIDVEERKVNVLFIDLGCEGQVSASEVFVMHPQLMAEPAASVLCALTGCAPLNEEGMWTETAILQFQDLVCDKIIQMQMVHPCGKTSHFGTPNLVNLVFKMKVSSRMGSESSVSKPVRVSRELIRKGCAKNISLHDQIAILHVTKSITNDCSGRLNQLRSLVAAARLQGIDNTVFSNPFNPAQPPFKRPLPLPFSSLSKTALKQNTATSVLSKHVELPSNSMQKSTPPTAEELNNFNLGYEVNKKLLHLGSMMKARMTKAQSMDDLENFSDDSDKSNDQSEVDSSDMTSKEADKEYEMPIMISSVISPNSFFVHVVNARTAHTLNALEQELKTLFQGRSNERQNFKPKKYSLCCAQFSQTNGFYRGLIVDISSPEQEGKYLVFFIDYGDFEWVEGAKVFPLPEQFVSISPLVLWCTLSYVVPKQVKSVLGTGEEQGNITASDWSLEAVRKFKSLATESQRLAAIVSNKSLMKLNDSSHFQMEPLPLYLLDRSSPGDDRCINHQLINQGHADVSSSMSVQNSGKPKPEGVIEIEGWDPMTEDFESFRNSYKVDTDDPGVALVGYKSSDNQLGARRVCVFYNSRSKCFKGKTCPFLHIKVDNDGLSYDQLPVLHFDQDQSDLLPQPNTLVALTVSTVISPSQFYVTLVWGRLTLEQVQYDSKAVEEYVQGETLESLMDSMSAFYHNSVYDGDMTALGFGQAVAAKVKDKWMRAKVVDTDPDAIIVQVHCIDFGDTQWISEKDVRELDLRFIHLSPQAVECCLYGVEPTDNASYWSTEAISEFARLVADKTLIGFVRQRYLSGKIVLSMIDNTDDKDQDLTTQLIKAGLGKSSRKPDNLKNVDNEDQSTSGKTEKEIDDLVLFPA